MKFSGTFSRLLFAMLTICLLGGSAMAQDAAETAAEPAAKSTFDIIFSGGIFGVAMIVLLFVGDWQHRSDGGIAGHCVRNDRGVSKCGGNPRHRKCTTVSRRYLPSVGHDGRRFDRGDSFDRCVRDLPKPDRPVCC